MDIESYSQKEAAQSAAFLSARQCIAFASERYQVPELLLYAILSKEGGKVGQCVTNKDGSQDCGPAQINTKWKEYFEKQNVAWTSVVNNYCTNVSASAYILKKNYIRKGDWPRAIVSYNIGPNSWTPNRYEIGRKYASDVILRWTQYHKQVYGN